MADFPFTQGMGSPVYATAGAGAQNGAANPLTNITNLIAAGISVALIASVGVWGYKLMVRDVSGIPVVQAAAGEMRVRPQEPGGQLALNQGLSVNAVAAGGVAQAPVDRLTLAPKPVALTQEDMPIPVGMVAPVQQPAALNPASNIDQNIDVAGALQAGSVEDLVAQLTAGSQRIVADETDTAPKVVAAITPSTEAMPTAVVATNAVLRGPGIKRSLRPLLRPANAPSVVVPVSAPAAVATNEIDAASLPAGTRLVQLGAFDSAEVAREQWGKLEGRFGDFLYGKSRIVQKAKSGGRTFYRLRALGFEDLSDARRFCSALLAKKADCIPVVTR
jgi:hypothetical protein